MNLKETIENITNQHISEGIQRIERVRNSIEKNSAARPRPAGGFQHTDAEHGKLISGTLKQSARASSSRIQNKPGSETPAKPSAKPSLLGKIGSGIKSGFKVAKQVVGLKEYYKEILNNLLMTEVTASPKGQAVEPGSLRADRLAGLRQEFARNEAENGPHYRSKRIAHLLQAKGSNTDGDLNIKGHASRVVDAEKSNKFRTGDGAGWNDKRSDEQKQRMGNAARFAARSAPGGDD